MKPINSKLFEKFEDLEIVNKSFKKIVRRKLIEPKESRATEDNSTSTDLFVDSVFTACGQDN